MSEETPETNLSPPEATGNNEGWFNSWLNAAKNKSTEVLEFVKKDLEEFGTAVKNEASSVVTSAGSVMEKTLSLESPDSTVNTVKRSFSTFLGQMNTVLNPSPDDDDTEILIVENSETHELNEYQKSLFALQNDPETYLIDPKNTEQYNCWLEILESDQLSDARIAKYVNNSEILKKNYAKYVPEIIEHQLFWKRYLFKKALLEDEMAKRELQERIKEKNEIKEKWLQINDVELSEEQQIALLEEYENEQKSKKIINTTSEEKKDDIKEKWAQINDVELSEEQQIALLEEYENEQKNKKIVTTPSKKNKDYVTGPMKTKEMTGSSGSSTDDDWEKIGDLDK